MKIGDKYEKQHEDITDLEFEMIELVSKGELSEFREELKELKSLYDRHWG